MTSREAKFKLRHCRNPPSVTASVTMRKKLAATTSKQQPNKTGDS
jgi:hypothetical protein